MSYITVSIYKNGKCKNIPRNGGNTPRIKIAKILQNDRALGEEIDASDGFVISHLKAKEQKLFLKNQGMILTIPSLLENKGYNSFDIAILMGKRKGLSDKEIAKANAFTLAMVTTRFASIYYQNEVNNFEEWEAKLWE